MRRSCVGRVWVVLRRCGKGVRLAYGSPDTRPPDVPRSRGDGVRLAYGSPDTRPPDVPRSRGDGVRLAYGSPDTRPPDVPRSRGDGVRLAYGSPDTRPQLYRWRSAARRAAPDLGGSSLASSSGKLRTVAHHQPVHRYFRSSGSPG